MFFGALLSDTRDVLFLENIGNAGWLEDICMNFQWNLMLWLWLDFVSPFSPLISLCIRLHEPLLLSTCPLEVADFGDLEDQWHIRKRDVKRDLLSFCGKSMLITQRLALLNPSAKLSTLESMMLENQSLSCALRSLRTRASWKGRTCLSSCVQVEYKCLLLGGCRLWDLNVVIDGLVYEEGINVCVYFYLPFQMHMQGAKPALWRADIRRVSAGYPPSGGVLRRSPPDGFSVTSRMQKRPKTSSSPTFSDCFPIFNKIPKNF